MFAVVVGSSFTADGGCSCRGDGGALEVATDGSAGVGLLGGGERGLGGVIAMMDLFVASLYL
jgi:hypothetical protein